MKVAVLCLVGSMAPVTLDHVEMLREARSVVLGQSPAVEPAGFLPAARYAVGLIGLNSDHHVDQKLEEVGMLEFPIEDRAELVRIATAPPELRWIVPAHPTLPDELILALESRWPQLVFTTWVVEGADIVIKKLHEESSKRRLSHFMPKTSGGLRRHITLGQAGCTDALRAAMRVSGSEFSNNFVLGRECPDVSVSSSAARELLVAGAQSVAELSKVLNPAVAKWCFEHGPYRSSCRHSETQNPTPSPTGRKPGVLTVSTALGFAVVSGLCAAAASTFSKLGMAVDATGAEAFASWFGSEAGSAGNGDPSLLLQSPLWAARCCCGAAMVVSNAVMWATFSKALALSPSSLEPTAVNTAANLAGSMVLGSAVFEEKISLLWWVGATLILIGVTLVRGSDTGAERDDELHEKSA